MRVFDSAGNELAEYDLSLGHLVPDKLFLSYHEATEAVAEQGHWETLAEYPNGGKDVAWVVDTPGKPAKGAWDEYEDIQRYVPYTTEELAEMAKPSAEERIAEIEAALELLLSGVTE